MINCQILSQFLERHQINKQFNRYILSTPIKDFALIVFDKESFKKECQKLNLKGSTKLKVGNQEVLREKSWKKRQLKMFIWFVLFYCSTHSSSTLKLVIEHFTQIKNDFQFFQSIFTSQTSLRLQFEVKLHFESKQASKQKWTSDETLLLKKIISENENKNIKYQWKSISYKLFCLSEGEYLRPFRQCRQMWMNHLDPRVYKKDWSNTEDLTLMELIEYHHFSWSQISKKLGGVRTQHMVKNRYNSLIKFEKKKNEFASIQQLQNLILKRLKSKQTQRIEIEQKLQRVEEFLDQKHDEVGDQKKSIDQLLPLSNQSKNQDSDLLVPLLMEKVGIKQIKHEIDGYNFDHMLEPNSLFEVQSYNILIGGFDNLDAIINEKLI